MMQHPFHSTAWGMHRHFASHTRSLSGEARRIGKVAKRMGDDDQSVAPNRGGTDSMHEENDRRTPEKRWANIRLENADRRVRPAELIETMQNMNATELSSFFEEDPDAIKLAVLERNRSGAKQVIKALDEKLIKDPVLFRDHIIELIQTNKSPKDDEKLQAIMEGTRKETKEAEQSDEPSFWNKLLMRMAEDFRKEFSPLYGPLARVLLTPSVRKSFGRSPKSLFDSLNDPKQRIELLHNLADLRYILFDDASLDARTRAARLDDLLMCLEQTGEFLTAEERRECSHLIAMVGAVRSHAHVLAGKPERAGDDRTKDAERTEYEMKIHNLRSFFRGEKGQPKNIRGKDGLREKLKKEGGNDPAVALIAKGLEDGEWIDRLHPSEEFRYACTLIALEELGILYNRILRGHTTMHPADVMENVKRLIAHAFRVGLRGFQRNNDSPFTVEEIDPRNDFEELRKNIDRQFESGEHPSESDIDELILLGIIYGEREGKKILTQEEANTYRSQSEPTDAELDARAKEERRMLVSAVAESSTLRADVLQKADLPELRSAQAELEEEATLAEQREQLKKKNGRTKKDEARLHAEPHDTFRKICDREHAEKRIVILENASLTDEEKKSKLQTIEAEYEQERKLRQRLHETNVRQGWGKQLLSLIGTEIAREASSFQKNYLAGMAPLLQKRARLLQEQYGNIEEAPDDELLRPEEAETFDKLNQLRSSRINPNSPTSYQDIGTALHDLRYMENEIGESPEKKVDEENTRRVHARRDASSILSYNNNDLPDEITTALTAHAAEQSRPSPVVQKGLTMCAEHPKLFAQAAREEANITRESPSLRGMEEDALAIAAELHSVLPSFIGGDETFGAVVRERINCEIKTCMRGIRAAEKRLPLANKELAEAERARRRLRAIMDTLHAANREPITLPYNDFQKFAADNGLPSYTWGAYDRKRRRIILNADKVDHYGARESVLTEERRHALHAALGEAFPLYLEHAFDSFMPRIGRDDLRKEFLALAELWEPRGTLTESEWKSEVMDEFLAKRAVYQTYAHEHTGDGPGPKHIALSEREIAFFRKISPYEQGLLFEFREQEGSSLLTRSAKAASRDEEGGTAVAEPLMEESKAPQELETIRQMFIKIRGFLDAEEGFQTPDNITYIQELENEYDRVLAKWRTKSAESRDAVRNHITSLHNEVGSIVEKINEHDKNARDLTNVPEKFDLWFTIWNDINWVTMSDIVGFVTAIKEDIKRQYERRQQARIGRVGESVTSWIQNVPILRDIPYINALSSEFKRRESQSESEEVNKYKEAYIERDSYELQEMLHSPSSKDQMKALLHLLSERGRVDWNDVEFWKALNHLSRFKMPIKECQRNESLREDWLRKQMQDIFGDKDQYRSWKGANDGKIKSGKSEFTTEADRLSNLKGGLAGELEKQLYLFVQAKEKGESIPDDVQPHLYEEILEYSIRNGKMSMEDKFFYLVQGIAHGIIGRDRLGYLAGEGSGILNIFGFIDYFYGRNNTQQEIESLAKRLRQSNDKSKAEYYKPGMKTTLWLELEVAREESVIQRVNKGMSKRGGETDHDDMHFFIPRVDADSVASLTTPQGGGRQQLTPQAWENAYSGFNSFFKSFGILAKLEQDGFDKFSSQDAIEVVRATATFVRMDSILTRRDTFDDNGGRRATLGWNTMRSHRSVVNTNGESVYKERSKVDAFVKALIRAYNLPPEYVDVMLYNTEDEGMFNAAKMERTKKLSYEFESVLRKALQNQGVTKMKTLLREFEPRLNTHEEGYNYTNISAIRKKEAKQGTR